MFVGLGWEKEIRSLGDPHVPFNPLSEHDIGATNQYSDDYELTPYLQSIQARRWKMQEEQKQYAKNDKRQANMQEKDETKCMNNEANDTTDLNEDKSINTEQEIKVVGESSRSLSFRDRMRGLSPHRRPLKDRFCTLICFDRVHLHQEGTRKRRPKHVGGWKHRSIVDRHSRHAKLNM